MDGTLAQILESLFATTQRVRDLELALAGNKESTNDAAKWGEIPGVQDAIGQTRAPGDLYQNGQGPRDESPTEAPY